jgi:hypothetical protein
MSDAMERVLRLVAEGKLSAEDAAPILDALSARDAARSTGEAAGAGAADAGRAPTPGSGPSPGDGSGAKFARIMVMEGGRRVVDLRVPTSLGRLALGKVPGLSAEQVTELQQAISIGRTGPLLEVEDPDGDGVKIVLE